MFIFITEDGQAYQRGFVEDEDKMSADAGILDIIDTAGDLALQYCGDSEWRELETWGE